MRWAAEDSDVVTLVGRDVDRLRRDLAPRARLVVLTSGDDAPARIASLLVEEGYAASRLTVLGDLGSAAESRTEGVAASWDGPPTPRLHLVCVECDPHPTRSARSLVPGLSETAYEHDGQLTKREVRAITLAVLAPGPGELLWDVGGGAGSIGIEWMRAHRSCQAICVESDPVRAQRIMTNAEALGVPDLRVVSGRAPTALHGLTTPDAVFVGGGLTADGMLEACWGSLRPGGRLVANAVTVESEAVLGEWHSSVGGELRRISVSRGRPVGRFTGWDPARSITQWSVTKPSQNRERT
jgi:precorrin-6Y C5,15-methyltransferase (decarboxylating)